MKKIITFLALFLAVTSHVYCQKPLIEFSFTGLLIQQHINLDSIRIENTTQGGDTTLYWPDTVLSIIYNGLTDQPAMEGNFTLFQNTPNPTDGQTSVKMYVPGTGKVEVFAIDLSGRQSSLFSRVLDPGYHSFTFTPGPEKVYYLTARWQHHNEVIKILNMSTMPANKISLSYQGKETGPVQTKSLSTLSGFQYGACDILKLTAYSDTLVSSFTHQPSGSWTYTFQFGMNFPCPGLPSFVYGGQTYNTVQIGNQCWMKENLNIGTMINGSSEQTNNAIIEKYCYNDDPANCAIYGGLYQWDEMMQYTITPGTQGICPSGWHIPTDAEWCILTTYLDTTIICNTWGLSGTNAGGKMKETGTTHWYSPNTGATNESGFAALGAGARSSNGFFSNLSFTAFFWSSSEYSTSSGIYRNLYYGYANVYRYYYNKTYGFSVRCVRTN